MTVSFKKTKPVFSTADILYDVLRDNKKVGALGRQIQDQRSFGYKKGEWGWASLALGKNIPFAATLGKDEKKAKQAVVSMLEEKLQETNEFIKQYIEIRGGVSELEEEEKSSLVSLSEATI